MLLDAGFEYAAWRKPVVNAAAGVGRGEVYPDCKLTVEWAIYFDRPWLGMH